MYVGYEKYKGDETETHQYKNQSKKAYLTAFTLWWNPYQKKYLEKSKTQSGYKINIDSYHKSDDYTKDEKYYKKHCTLEYGA